ncbi:MAG: conjugal transfer protein [Ruminococcus sp.]|nr:conjugal transfer protein [Ruminococcus sp.]
MFKKKEKIEGAVKTKEKRIRTVKVNTHKKCVLFLWILLLGSLAFAVYKNFTAVDSHTVHETERIEEKLVDTNAVETFTRSFAWNYYGWENSREGLEKWQESLKNYMTEDLQKLNMSSMPSGLSTLSRVTSVDIWSVKKAGKSEYEVVYSVWQEITEGKEVQYIPGTYLTRVHEDSKGNLVIVQNPSLYRSPEVSDYRPKEPVSDSNLMDKQDEIVVFLDTFFKMYPVATDNELEFYVADSALPSVNMERYQYNKLEQVALNEGADDTVKAAVTVSYLDTVTKLTQYNQFELILKKGDNWKIIGTGFTGQ